jgi:uncharacterized protein with FMN-binding domain
MKRVIASLFGTVTGLVMLLNFKTTGSTAASAPPAVSATGPDTASTGGSTTPTTPTSTSTTTSKTSSTPATTTFTGDSIDTQWGPVQVRITVTNGKLASVTAIDYPWNNGRDQEINSYAVPALNKEALAAGNAQIDMISGATYTSTGYIASLQSALDKAGL